MIQVRKQQWLRTRALAVEWGLAGLWVNFGHRGDSRTALMDWRLG